MRELLSVYHPDIPSFLLELSRTPPMERLRQVGMNCGCEYTAFSLFQGLRPYSRFDHSMGVALIVWHFTGDMVQTIAGALHDVATPVFAHTVDFLLGDHVRQESTEAQTARSIESSPELSSLLSQWGLTTADIADYHRYPIADNDSPRLAADRLEYTMGNLLNYKLCPLSQLRELYEDLTILENEDGVPELGFQNSEQAISFTQIALQTSRIYVADEDRFAMELLAGLLRLGLERGILQPAHLHTTEPAVIRRLLTDPACARQWHRFCRCAAVRSTDSRPQAGTWFQIPAKLRYIDPLAQGLGRVSQWDKETARLLADFQNTTFDRWVGME